MQAIGRKKQLLELHMFIRSHSNITATAVTSSMSILDEATHYTLAHISLDCSYFKNELTDITAFLGEPIILQCHFFSPSFEDD